MGIGQLAMSFLSQYAAAIPGVLVSLIIPAFVDNISSGIISLLINFLWVPIHFLLPNANHLLFYFSIIIIK
jgi:uncharacterized membrane protein